jgi:hypothetical protein
VVDETIKQNNINTDISGLFLRIDYPAKKLRLMQNKDELVKLLFKLVFNLMNQR